MAIATYKYTNHFIVENNINFFFYHTQREKNVFV